VGAAAAVLLVAAALAGGGLLWWAQQRAGADAEARAALREAAGLLEEERWPEALSAARRAEGILAGVGADAGLRGQARALTRDLEMARQLQEARLRMADVKDGHFDWSAADEAYAAVFADYGLDVDGLDPQQAAAQVRARPIRRQLVAALDDWAFIRFQLKAEGWGQRLGVARAADPDPTRNRLRDVLEGHDPKAVEELIAAGAAEDWPAETLVLLGRLLFRINGRASCQQVAALLGRAQQRYPGDFWLNEGLGLLLAVSRPPRLEEALRFFSVSVALQPQSPGAHLNLGNALYDKGRLDESEAEYREAIRLKRDYAEAHTKLGNALYDKGRLDEAIAEYKEVLRLKPDYALAHSNLGAALYAKGRLDEAIAAYHEALRLKPDYAEAYTAHYNLGNALKDKGRLDEAIAAYHEALRLKPDFPEVHTNLGAALARKGQLDDAIAAYHEALRLKPDFPEAHIAHNNLGNALRQKGQLDEAIAEIRAALRLKPDFPLAHNNLGLALTDKGRLDEAIAECRAALRLRKDFPEAHYNLGNALYLKGQRDEAIAEYKEALRIKQDYAEVHNNLGAALYHKGQLDEAIAAYHEALRLKRDNAEAHVGLGAALKAKGRLDEAIAEYHEALRIKKDYPEAHCNLGYALSVSGRLDEAIVEYREAVRLKPDNPEAHGNLGVALMQKGQFRQAAEELRRGDELGSRNPRWPHARAQAQLRQAEHLAQLDARLPAVLQGKDRPKDAAERLGFAELCQLYRQRYAAAARLYADAFAAEPRLNGAQPSEPRYNAACAAALAGCGQGKDAPGLGEEEGCQLRLEALAWLRADLAAWRRLLDQGPAQARPAAVPQLQHWREDPDFAGVRGPDALAKLPEAERQGWGKLWDDVAETLRRAGGKPPQPREGEKKP
jgi:tetratricopeptide (TPR) repeat protein